MAALESMYSRLKKQPPNLVAMHHILEEKYHEEPSIAAWCRSRGADWHDLLNAIDLALGPEGSDLSAHEEKWRGLRGPSAIPLPTSLRREERARVRLLLLFKEWIRASLAEEETPGGKE